MEKVITEVFYSCKCIDIVINLTRYCSQSFYITIIWRLHKKLFTNYSKEETHSYRYKLHISVCLLGANTGIIPGTAWPLI